MELGMRIGFGVDVHAFATNRKLILGGVEIPFELGLEGHSDADVLIHAICDALLGACALGDIGKHFPNTDEKFKDISSLILLENVNKLLKEKNSSIMHIDSTIIAEKPKLLPYIDLMRKNISETLNISIDKISIKATTSEKLGFIGRQEGIIAFAIALVSYFSREV